MDRLGWGQKLGAVAQFAYVVEDLDQAIGHLIRDCSAGPFFVIEHFLQPGQVYRGQESTADLRLAMGFSGQSWIELMQPLDDHPSIYREVIEQRGFGLHHHGIAFEDCEAVLAQYQARGWREAYRSPVPTGGDVIFIESDEPSAAPFLELLPASPAMDAHFTGFWKAAQNWDGSDPIRPFA
ncbi:VOC family protein [Altererythrobacter sp.]|uniref:VOC family protein n=1 Tax=Altererythrobacter sp. TaxID=1872480 RepID=UPI003D06A110